MIPQFEKLTREEQQILFKAPVLVSVLASCSFNEVNKQQKADAIKLAHLKTFTAIHLLLPYYCEVEKKFKDQFDATVQRYFPFDEERMNALMRELKTVHAVRGKLDKDYAQALNDSLNRYAAHVKRATHSILQDFLFAFSIRGLSA